MSKKCPTLHFSFFLVLIRVLYLRCVTLRHHSERDLAFVCSVLPSDQTEVGAPVRLVSGASSAEGRLEVMINSTWGGVCSSGWSQASSEVVCNQLGFYGNASTAVYGQFGNPSYCKLRTTCTLSLSGLLCDQSGQVTLH